MEVANKVSDDNSISSDNNNNNKEEEGELVGQLPGFRFHPTDEELVGFYLKRKVDNKPISIELIKHIDIYKYDPWDLPKVSNVGDKEWYFFCIRGRKYRNSIRPNRVTGSGFWKATGIDKPIYSVKEPHDCIGLKKSLVYYRGSAGKGTKTDWMMHEFRLPPSNGNTTTATFPINIANKDNINNAQEAEVWTLCRIFKRIPSYKKYVPADNCKETTTRKASSSSSCCVILDQINDSSSKTCSLETDNYSTDPYVSLELNSSSNHHHQHHHHRNKRSKSVLANSEEAVIHGDETTSRGSSWIVGEFSNNYNVPLATHHHHQGQTFQAASNYPSFNNSNPNSSSNEDFFTNGGWDELRPVVQLAVDRHPSELYHIR